MFNPKLWMPFYGVFVVLVLVASSPVPRSRARRPGVGPKEVSSGAGEIFGYPDSERRLKDKPLPEDGLIFPSEEDNVEFGAGSPEFDFWEPSDVDYNRPAVDNDLYNGPGERPVSFPGVNKDNRDHGFDEDGRKDTKEDENEGDEKGIDEADVDEDDTEKEMDEDEKRPEDDEEGKKAIDEEEGKNSIDNESEEDSNEDEDDRKPHDEEDKPSDEDENHEKPLEEEDDNGSDEDDKHADEDEDEEKHADEDEEKHADEDEEKHADEEKHTDENEDEEKHAKDSDDVPGEEGEKVPDESEDKDHDDGEGAKHDEGSDEVDENSAEEDLPGFSGGFILDTPFFNMRQVSKYFQKLERALEHLFRETVDEATHLNGTYANTTEEEVEIDGKKYLVQKSIITKGDNDSSIYIEARSAEEERDDMQVPKNATL